MLLLWSNFPCQYCDLSIWLKHTQCFRVWCETGLIIHNRYIKNEWSATLVLALLPCERLVWSQLRNVLKKIKERMRSDSNMIMMPSELMIKKIKPLLFWLLLLALLSWSIMSQSRSLLVSSACQVDYIFLMASQAISKMMLHKTIWTDTFHVAGGDSFWHDKNTSQGQIWRRWKYQILKMTVALSVWQHSF